MDPTTGVAVLAGAASLTGVLLAGLYLAFALTVVPALSRLDDAAFVAAWRSINRVIVRSGFLVLPRRAGDVGGPGGGGPGSASGWPAALLWAGAAGQSAGLGFTGVAHVPLNTALDASASTSRAEVAAVRAAFETPWARRHRTRTALTALATALTVAGALAG